MDNNFKTKKSLGQHFLTSDYVPKKMCDAAKLGPSDLVLEIGPGTGVLTKEILHRGAQVLALETDSRALEFLEVEFAQSIKDQRLLLKDYDVRNLGSGELGLENKAYKVVANIPYYLSGFLFRTLLSAKWQPTSLVFLVQKEVASRIARDKKESLLSLSVKVYGDPTYICTVARGHFNPPPRIDSAVIAINNISRQNFVGFTEEEFFVVLHLGFGQKRKQLLSNLSAQYPRPHLEEIFDRLGLIRTIRAEDLSLENWLKLMAALKSPGFSPV